MISPRLRTLYTNKPFKSVHAPPLRLSDIPERAIIAGVLKALEEEFQARGMLPTQKNGLASSAFNPVWFLVETERNIFLWRNGCSLIQQDEFEFWINAPALIDKRLKQLACGDLQNPFLNPAWDGDLKADGVGNSQVGSEMFRVEMDYLNTFLELINKIAPHAHALSQVGSMLGTESTGNEKPRVLLPKSST